MVPFILELYLSDKVGVLSQKHNLKISVIFAFLCGVHDVLDHHVLKFLGVVCLEAPVRLEESDLHLLVIRIND